MRGERGTLKVSQAEGGAGDLLPFSGGRVPSPAPAYGYRRPVITPSTSADLVLAQATKM